MYFKDDYRLDVMTSTALVNKAPARFDWARYYSTFQKQSMSPRALAISVYHGYGFTPVWTTARREENFVSAGHMAFDFDAGDESSSLDYIQRVGTFAWMFASFGYTTASNTAAAPRCRVVFVLEYPIESPAEYRRVYQAVAWYISSDGSNTDPACKDPLRLYYGSKGAEVWDNWSLLGQGTIDYITETYAAAHPTMPASAKMTVPVSPTASMQDAKLATFGRAVRNAPLDAGHHTLLRVATTAGGYVASGSLDRAAVVAELTAAAMTRPEPNPADIERAINNGLDYGAARPLQFEAARRVGDLLP
jgi:hypothetical protein